MTAVLKIINQRDSQWFIGYGTLPIPFKDGGLLFAIILKTSSQGSREFNSFGPDVAHANER